MNGAFILEGGCSFYDMICLIYTENHQNNITFTNISQSYITNTSLYCFTNSTLHCISSTLPHYFIITPSSCFTQYINTVLSMSLHCFTKTSRTCFTISSLNCFFTNLFHQFIPLERTLANEFIFSLKRRGNFWGKRK